MSYTNNYVVSKIFMKEKDIEKNLRAMANGRRLMILKHLRLRKKLSVGEIAEKIHLSFRSTSRHLAILFIAGLVKKEQVNLQVFYMISDDLDFIFKKIIQSL